MTRGKKFVVAVLTLMGGTFLAFVILLIMFIRDCNRTEWEEKLMYTCTACLKTDPTKCNTQGMSWYYSSLNTEEDVRERAAFRLCDEVVSPEEEQEKHTCGDWVLHRREETFDIRCTSRLERRVKPWSLPVHN
jgi:hypothetical protein